MFHICTSCNAVDMETIFCPSPNTLLLSEQITMWIISVSLWPGAGGGGERKVEISTKMLHWPLLAALFTLFWMKLPKLLEGRGSLISQELQFNIHWLSTHIAVEQIDNVETLKHRIMIPIDIISTRNVPMCYLNICCNTRDAHVKLHYHKL